MYPLALDVFITPPCQTLLEYKMTTSQLFLASASPRRKELLTQLGYQFEILVSDIEEKEKNKNHQRHMSPVYPAKKQMSV